MIKLRGFCLKPKLLKGQYYCFGKTAHSFSTRGCIIGKKQPQEKSLKNFYDNH